MKIKATSRIKVELVQFAGSDEMIAHTARVSTRGKLRQKIKSMDMVGLINYLLKQKHGSPFEHNLITFRVRAPIFVWREWHRHRVGFSYNEQSARYMKLTPDFWIPTKGRPLIPAPSFKSARPQFVRASKRAHAAFVRRISRVYDICYAEYERLIRAGYSKETARAILPVGILSTCYVTCNARSLMHFLSLRTHKPKKARHVSYPQFEIAQAAGKCEKIFGKLFPVTRAAFDKFGRVAP